jgi:hypothetical protein
MFKQYVAFLKSFLNNKQQHSFVRCTMLTRHYSSKRNNIECSERMLIGHSFYRRNFLRKCCATCREKCRRAAPRTVKSDKPAAAFFSASGEALS